MARRPSSYAARNARYQTLGFRSYGEARRLGGGSASRAGLVGARADLERLPDAVVEQRDAGEETLAYARYHDVSLRSAERDLGLRGGARAAAFYFPDEVRHGGAGDLRASTEPGDHFRLMDIYVDDPLQPTRTVEVSSGKDASVVGAYKATVRAYLSGRVPADALRPFRGVRIGGYELLTDPRKLQALARAGMLHGSPYPRRGAA